MVKARATDIRAFRSALRRLERIVNFYNRVCCPHVTMAQCHVLLQIGADKRVTTKRLAETLNLDASTISRTVDGLVKARLVAREENPEDRRSLLLQLTAKGEGLRSDIDSDADAFFDQALQQMPEGRRSSVLESFEILVRAFADAEQVRQRSCAGCGCDED